MPVLVLWELKCVFAMYTKKKDIVLMSFFCTGCCFCSDSYPVCLRFLFRMTAVISIMITADIIRSKRM